MMKGSLEVILLAAGVAAIVMLTRPGSRGPAFVSQLGSLVTTAAAITEGATYTGPVGAAGTAATPAGAAPPAAATLPTTPGPSGPPLPHSGTLPGPFTQTF